MKSRHPSAFTLIEMLVVISIIAILAAFAVPALTNALTKGQMTGTMNNARQMYLAAFSMATDGATNSNPNFSWPGEDTSVKTLEDYCNKLVQNDYLKAGDVQKILSAPGAACVATATTADGVTSVKLTGKSALQVYQVKDVDASNTIFGSTANYVYNTALDKAKAPYGDKGFVVVRKGGDASVYRKNEAAASSYGAADAGVQKFQAAVGKLPNDSSEPLTNP